MLKVAVKPLSIHLENRTLPLAIPCPDPPTRTPPLGGPVVRKKVTEFSQCFPPCHSDCLDLDRVFTGGTRGRALLTCLRNFGGARPGPAGGSSWPAPARRGLTVRSGPF